MKILHTVELYHPSAGGMYEVVKQLSEKLVEFGHDLTVATTKFPDRYRADWHGVKIKEFDISGNFVLGIKGEIEKYHDFLINSNFDVITNFAAQQPMTDAMLLVLDKIKTKKIFVPTGFSALYKTEYKNYFKKMQEWMKHYDMNVFLSNDYRDINFARDNKVIKYTIITNGASEYEFLKKKINIFIRKKLSIQKDHFLILHVGSHTGKKGHNESIKIFTKAKIKNTTFLIVGNGYNGCAKKCKFKKILNFSPNYIINNKKLLIKSLSRDETIMAYKEADLFLFPSNLECSPIVLFECMASKTPFITTDVGNAQEIIKWSDGGILLPTIKDAKFDAPLLYKIKIFLRNILVCLKIYKRLNPRNNLGISRVQIKESIKLLELLYNDRKKLDKLANNGYEAWFAKFKWEQIAKKYENLYKTLL